MISKLITIIMLLMLPEVSSACAGGPRHGYGLSLEQLVDKTNNIVLARFTEEEKGKIDFNIIETIKTSKLIPATESIKSFTVQIGRYHNRFNIEHNPTDFVAHSDPAFWANETKLQVELVSRVQWRGGMCTPAFTFLAGEQYLLFLDSPGSFYAAEIIKSKEDRWYQYVSKRVQNS